MRTSGCTNEWGLTETEQNAFYNAYEWFQEMDLLEEQEKDLECFCDGLSAEVVKETREELEYGRENLRKSNPFIGWVVNNAYVSQIIQAEVMDRLEDQENEYQENEE